MKKLKKVTYEYDIDSEKEADLTIEEYKNKQYDEGYTVLKTKVDYKAKKDRKTGEITEEKWITSVTLGYEV